MENRNRLDFWKNLYQNKFAAILSSDSNQTFSFQEMLTININLVNLT